VGDDGLAVGLHQFHAAAWSDCWGDVGWGCLDRHDPLSSFRAAIRYQQIADKGLIRAQPPKTLRAYRSSRHHLGHYDLNDKKYIGRVERRYQKLVKDHGGK